MAILVLSATSSGQDRGYSSAECNNGSDPRSPCRVQKLKQSAKCKLVIKIPPSGYQDIFPTVFISRLRLRGELVPMCAASTVSGEAAVSTFGLQLQFSSDFGGTRSFSNAEQVYQPGVLSQCLVCKPAIIKVQLWLVNVQI